MPEKKKRSLTARILMGMALGILTGVLLNLAGNDGLIRVLFSDGIFLVVGTLFLRSLQLMVVPLVFVSLVCGTASMEDVRRLGRIGGKTLALYLLTTTIAISFALGIGLLVKPGKGMELATEEDFVTPEAPPLSEVLIDMIPNNPMEALAEGNMLQIIVFAMLFGLALTISGQPGRSVLQIFESLNEVVMRLVMLIIELAPIGVFALLARTFANEGFDTIIPLAKYFFTLAAVLILHAVCTYSLFLKIIGNLNPVQFFRKMRTAQIFALTTSSSNATIPVTLETVEEELGVDNSISSFTVPLGATINMDGTAIMQGIATVFVAQSIQLDLSFGQILTVLLMATLASIGSAGVPSAGLIMLTAILTQVNLPIAAIPILLSIDRLLDMLRTVVNITGDAAMTCIIGKSEGKMDLSRFEDNSWRN